LKYFIILNLNLYYYPLSKLDFLFFFKHIFSNSAKSNPLTIFHFAYLYFLPSLYVLPSYKVSPCNNTVVRELTEPVTRAPKLSKRFVISSSFKLNSPVITIFTSLNRPSIILESFDLSFFPFLFVAVLIFLNFFLF
jgi:hypothetical protein